MNSKFVIFGDTLLFVSIYDRNPLIEGEPHAPLGCKRKACKKSWHYPCAMEPTEGKPNELEFSMRSPLSNKFAIKELRGVPARAAR